MIDVEREPLPESPFERCCFCRNPTPFWTNDPGRKPGCQVACCESCATVANSIDIPSKTTWCRREAIAHDGQMPGHLRRGQT